MDTDHAVIIGAGIGGLLTAHVLADTFDTVTVLDRDSLPDTPASRRAVPQDRQAHLLLARGLDAFEAIMPGFRADLEAQGVPFGDDQADVRYYASGRRLPPSASGHTTGAVSRVLLEHLTRQRVAGHPRIRVVSGRTVSGLTASAGGARITGVRTADGTLPASIVVDAGGRGGHSARWLAEHGYPPPPVETVRIGMTYVSRRYRYDPALLDAPLGVIVPSFPGQPYGGAAGREDADRIVLGLQAMLDADLPTDQEGLLTIAGRLPDPALAGILRHAEPVGEPSRMRFPESVRRRYERARRFPAGYLVIGDALCSFNPIYAQGMTVAALEALLLRELMHAGPTGDLARRFFRGAARLIDVPWSVATGGDLRFPEVDGIRTPATRLAGAYLGRYQRAAHTDPVLSAAFLRVANLIDPPARLFAPALLLRVARAG
ncbi:squalene monooxygenase [Catenuloplanes indicus]|uniref:2-polyprenyl-6-methoxyphenol hydroxylase-like FAD-dependent oxidoreductase n=1 Tax=Catenuloplanes indicus TaxID=137267 RepID=A0AAE3VXC9_9ACTN|nr:squalene monooxygenase [Catenuloplanes indicus]MDQ0365032.1 2-polyprenyl-6-methoxyphenol hydroxylase-like FAD-dependent oxidoreductase [Catenuloplanes indicus]